MKNKNKNYSYLHHIRSGKKLPKKILLFWLLSSPFKIVECIRKNFNNIRFHKLQIYNILSVSSSLFHPISNWHYFLPYSLFHMLNSSKRSCAFLSKLVSLWTQFIYYFLNWIIYYVSYFLNYICCKLVTLWSSVILELYERCYRKFGYEWKIMTLNPNV